jgi:hypothetical protein
VKDQRPVEVCRDPNTQKTIDEDACHEYLSQLVDRFSTEYGPGGALALWASQALSVCGANRAGESNALGLRDEPG